MLSPITLKFLEAIKINNTTTRMHTHKDLYIQERDRYFDTIDNLLTQMKKIDANLEDITTKDCIYRFNKDIRFSKDKSPYKTHFGAFMSPGGRKSPMPGYYLHIQPENASGISGGSRCPSPAQREAILLHIWKNWDQRESIVKNSAFSTYFGGLTDKDEVNLERRLKTSKTKKILEALGKTRAKKILATPEALEMLLYSRFCVRHSVKDEEVVKEKFEQEVMKGFKILKPFNDFLLEAF
jgi:uncharacterized protein (TIGR02453 family)